MIHIICGTQNNGKTFFMSYLGLNDYLEGRVIISNYKLSYPHYLINKDFIFWLGKEQPVFNNVTFLLDELWLWLDSRNAMTNTIATYFFLQSSKSNANIYITSQHIGQLELRIRQNLHRFTETQRFLKVGKKFKPVISEHRDLGKELNPYLYINAKTRERTSSILFNAFSKPKSIFLKADKYFKLYNTYEKKKII